MHTSSNSGYRRPLSSKVWSWENSSRFRVIHMEQIFPFGRPCRPFTRLIITVIQDATALLPARPQRQANSDGEAESIPHRLVYASRYGSSRLWLVRSNGIGLMISRITVSVPKRMCKTYLVRPPLTWERIPTA